MRNLVQLYIPGCTSITPEGVVRIVKSNGRLKYLRLHGLSNIKREHLNILKSLLRKSSRQEASHSYFYSNWRSLPLNSDDGRPIDVDICPKCKNVGMVFDCTRQDCRMMRNRWSPCRGCFFCIARCEECGGCLDAEELGEDTACSHLLCAGCWLQLPKCNFCFAPGGIFFLARRRVQASPAPGLRPARPGQPTTGPQACPWPGSGFSRARPTRAFPAGPGRTFWAQAFCLASYG
ncbi:F-box protein SKIP14 [Platanthera guangdongensis]|uniref:F-box protein SKIP14 n=1 Tax=Platanthera guangdongensis TaxID=2320717 RepID=A0ABR2M6D4_9ASPA